MGSRPVERVTLPGTVLSVAAITRRPVSASAKRVPHRLSAFVGTHGSWHRPSLTVGSIDTDPRTALPAVHTIIAPVLFFANIFTRPSESIRSGSPLTTDLKDARIDAFICRKSVAELLKRVHAAAISWLSARFRIVQYAERHFTGRRGPRIFRLQSPILIVTISS